MSFRLSPSRRACFVMFVIFFLAFPQLASPVHPTAPPQALKEPKQLPQDHTKNHPCFDPEKSLRKKHGQLVTPKMVMIFQEVGRSTETSRSFFSIFASIGCNMFEPFNHVHLPHQQTIMGHALTPKKTRTSPAHLFFVFVLLVFLAKYRRHFRGSCLRWRRWGLT